MIGPWVGGGSSPFGEMPFALLFERQPDGSARAWLDDGAGTSIDLHLRPSPTGWLLAETASLPGVGTQSYTLVPVSAAADRLAWRHPQRPDFLTVELRLPAPATPGTAPASAGEPAQLHLVARVRGEDHVAFTMKRLPDAAAAEMRRRLHPPGTRPPTTPAAPSAATSSAR